MHLSVESGPRLELLSYETSMQRVLRPVKLDRYG